jgi:hypothetical protein
MSAPSRPNLAARRARAGLDPVPDPVPPLDDEAGPGEGEGDVAGILEAARPRPPDG